MSKATDILDLGLDCLVALRFRSLDALRKLPLSGTRLFGQAVGQIAATAGLVLVSLEVGMFIGSGRTFPIPSIFIEYGAVFLGIVFSLLLAPFGVLYLKAKGQKLDWAPAFACSLYVATSAVALGALFVFVTSRLAPHLAHVAGIPASLIKSSINSLARNLIWFDSALLFFWVLEERGLIRKIDRTTAGCLFYVSVGLLLGVPLGILLYLLG